MSRLHPAARILMLAVAFSAANMFRGTNVASGEDDDKFKADVSSKAYAILKERCYQCHGVQENTPGLDVLDHTKMVAPRGAGKDPFVLAKDPSKSKLWVQIEKDLMPQDAPLPVEEKAILKQWIVGGAEFPVVTKDQRKFKSNLDILKVIHDHLVQTQAVNRPFQRYLSLTHLYNQPAVLERDLRLERAALSKALNSLSRDATITLPKAIDPEQTLFVIDLRQYDWPAATWAKVRAEYPYGVEPRDPKANQLYGNIQSMLGVSFDGVPCIRADWFTATATRPPLYYDLLNLPKTLGELERDLGVDRTRDFKENRLARGGVQISGVSSQNRLVDVHSSKRGDYWISYDFKANSGRGNLTRFPLGPRFDGNIFNDNAFEAAGSEIVFPLANRLFGYFLVKEDGARIDDGPVKIVNDSARTSGTPEIVNGISCIACHKFGLRDFSDELGPSLGLQNADARVKALDLFNADNMQARLKRSKNEFLRALEETIGPFLLVGDDARLTIDKFPEPIQFVARHYDRDLTLESAAAEMGIDDPARLKANLRVDSLRSLGLGPLDQGKTIKRSMWAARDASKSPFQEAIQALGDGTPVP